MKILFGFASVLALACGFLPLSSAQAAPQATARAITNRYFVQFRKGFVDEGKLFEAFGLLTREQQR